MCDACVIESVKDRMLTRRNLFKVGALGAAAAVAGCSGKTPFSMAAGHSEVTDMTHELHHDFPTYFGTPGFSAEQKFKFADSGLNLFELTINEHTGTHMDAPLHFSADGQAVNEIPVANLVAPLCVIHIHEKAAENADAQVTPDDIAAWVAKHGPIPDGACVAMHSGWENHVNTAKFRNADDAGTMHFPGFHIEATQLLLETGAVGMAVDTLSLDHGPSADFVTHYAWLPTNRWGLENVANLAKVPPAGATLVVGAPKHRGGSGGPARVFAMV
jgi:kynurenine formamidase